MVLTKVERPLDRPGTVRTDLFDSQGDASIGLDRTRGEDLLDCAVCQPSRFERLRNEGATGMLAFRRTAPLTLGTDLLHTFMLVGDRGRSAADLARCVDLSRFERGVFQSRPGDYRLDNDASASPEHISVVCFPDEVPFELVEVVAEIRGRIVFNPVVQLRERHRIVVGRRIVRLPERQ